MSGRPGILWFVLDKDSHEKLRQLVSPLYKNAYCHHVTLRYGIERNEVAAFIDKKWTIKAVAAAHNSEAQACPVETNGLPDEYGVPHVTISTAEGIAPFASVTMLQGEHEARPLDSPIELTGTVEFEYLDQVKD